MNWGLFLALTSFLLPLAFALRLIGNALWTRATASRALQWLRVDQLLLVSVVICGKTPTMIFALTGRDATLGHVTEAFMVTPWGFAQLTLLLLALGATEGSSPLIIGRLEAAPAPVASPRGYYARHAAVLLICAGLAWAAAR